MLSDRVYKAIAALTPMYAFVGIFPFTFDSKSRLFRASPRLRRRLQIVTFCLALGVAYYIVQSIRFNYTEQYDNFALVYALACFALISFQCQLRQFLDFDNDLLCLLNHILRYLTYINRNYYPNHDPNTSRRTKLIELVAVGILLDMAGNHLLFTVGVLMYPRSVINPGYLTSTSWPIFLRIPLEYGPILFIGQGVNWIMTTLMIMIYFFGAFTIPVILDFRLDRNKSYRSVEGLRRPENLTLAYRAAQILHEEMLNYFGIFLVPLQTIVTNLLMVSVYLLARHGDSMKELTKYMMIAWCTAGPFAYAVLLQIGGILHRLGLDVLKSWKYHEWNSRDEKRLMSKFRRSCKPITIHFQKAYTIRRLTILRYLRGLSRGIFRTLLAL